MTIFQTYKAEDEENKHKQKCIKWYSLAPYERVFHMERYYCAHEWALDLLEIQLYQMQHPKRKVEH